MASGHFERRVLVRCSCGDEREISTRSLVHSKVSSCRFCSNTSRLRCKTGSTWDHLTVIGREKLGDRVHVVCRCSCGNIVKTRPEMLTHNKSNSCGCQPGANWKGVGKLSKTFFNRLMSNAKTRGLTVSITPNQAWELLEQQNHRCKITNLPIYLGLGVKDPCTASVDRIDPELGYTLGNVQWVHKVVNMMKRDLDQKRFLAFCQAIAKNQTEDFSDHLIDPPASTRWTQRGSRKVKVSERTPCIPRQ